MTDPIRQFIAAARGRADDALAAEHGDPEPLQDIARYDLPLALYAIAMLDGFVQRTARTDPENGGAARLVRADVARILAGEKL